MEPAFASATWLAWDDFNLPRTWPRIFADLRGSKIKISHTEDTGVPLGRSTISMKRILLSWSSGKDSAWSLHLLRRLGWHGMILPCHKLGHGSSRIYADRKSRPLTQRTLGNTG